METIWEIIVVVFIILFILVFINVMLWWIKQGKVIREKREQWKKDDDLPLTIVEAAIVAKQERECLQSGVTGKSTTFMTYRATFEFKNGERKEFSISLPEYNLIAEGDTVLLSLQGKRYIRLEKRRF